MHFTSRNVMISHIFDCFKDAVDFKWCGKKYGQYTDRLTCTTGYYLFFQFLNLFYLTFLVKGEHPFIVKTLVNTSANFHDGHRNVNGSIIDPIINQVTFCSMIHVLTVPLTGMPNFNGISSPFLMAQNVCLKSGVLV